MPAAQPTLIPRTGLRHGDVLTYEYRSHQSILVRGIRLVTGSRCVHVGVVVSYQGILYVLEQLPKRSMIPLSQYSGALGSEIHAVRPKFAVQRLDHSLVDTTAYGYMGIVDCLINHALGRILTYWDYRPMLSTIWPQNVICSALVAIVLDLPKHAKWCQFPAVSEPDDYVNHTETFDYLGKIDWDK